MSDNHGNTVAAWTAVGIAILAFVVAGIGTMIPNWFVFWVGAIMLPTLNTIQFGIMVPMPATTNARIAIPTAVLAATVLPWLSDMQGLLDGGSAGRSSEV